MKKSLSLLLAIAMVFTMFSGVTFAADNGSDSKAKLYAAGVLKGSLSGDTMDDATWSRQDVTVLLSRLYDVEAEAQATEKGHTFTDVTDSFYDGFITWAVEEELFTGHSDVRFGYGEDITAQQFAAVLLRALDVAYDYADAVAAAVEVGIFDEEVDNDTAVLRGASYDILVATLDVEDQDGKSLGERLGLDGWVPELPAISATPVGVQTVEVVFNTSIDTEKATLSLSRGTSSVGTSTEWAEDAKSAKLKLNNNVKIVEADYTVTLKIEGEDPITASFSAEAEQVTSIEFVTTSDEIVRSTRAQIRIAATNQYGELASYNASSFTASAIGLEQSLRKDDDGYMVLTIDTNDSSLIPGVSQIPVYVYYDDSRLTAHKTFKVSTQAFVSHVELGEITYNNGESSLKRAGETAEISVKLFDQFGNPMTPDQVDSDNKPSVDLKINDDINIIVSPHHIALDTSSRRDNNEYTAVVLVKADEVIEVPSTHEVNVFAGGASASTSIDLGTSRVAHTVRIGDIDGVLAEGDGAFLVPIFVEDLEGNELTAQEIVDNKERIIINSSGAFQSNAYLISLGKDKGKVRVPGIDGKSGSYGFLSVSIRTVNSNSYDDKRFKIEDKRIPDSVALASAPHDKAVRGANSKFEFEVRDQYGKDLDYTLADYRVSLQVTNVDGRAAGNSVTASVYGGGIPSSGLIDANGEHFFANIASFNDEIEFRTNNGDIGRTTALARLYKVENGQDVEISRASATIESISNNSRLTYSLKSVGDMYAALSSDLLKTGQGNIPGSLLSKGVELEVKDAANKSVAYPENLYRYAAVGNTNVLNINDSADTKPIIIGDEAGTSAVTVTFEAADGTTKHLTTTVNVKDDLVRITSIEADNDEITLVTNIPDIAVAMDLEVKDQYGNKYAGTQIYDHDALTGIRYTISDIRLDNKNLTGAVNEVRVSLRTDNTGYEITVGSNVEEFVITAVSRDGEASATTIVTK